MKKVVEVRVVAQSIERDPEGGAQSLVTGFRLEIEFLDGSLRAVEETFDPRQAPTVETFNQLIEVWNRRLRGRP